MKTEKQILEKLADARALFAEMKADPDKHDHTDLSVANASVLTLEWLFSDKEMIFPQEKK